MGDFAREFAAFYNGINVNDYIEQGVNSIYHYTSPDGLYSIIKNSKLRFTDRSYLNDTTEGTYVLELCKNNIDRFNTLPDAFKKEVKKKCGDRLKHPQNDRFYVFQCSFSVDKDSLCLWNYYTKSDSIKGYNLEFNLREPDKLIIPTVKMDHKSPPLRYGKVVYNEQQQLKILRKIIQAFCDFSHKYQDKYTPFVCEYLVNKIMFLGIFFKKNCFEVENEFRLAFDLYLYDNKTYATIDDKLSFYVKNGVFVPYVDLNFDREKLTGVGVSPTLDFSVSKDSILRMVGNQYPNLGEDAVYKSAIPLRY